MNEANCRAPLYWYVPPVQTALRTCLLSSPGTSEQIDVQSGSLGSSLSCSHVRYCMAPRLLGCVNCLAGTFRRRCRLSDFRAAYLTSTGRRFPEQYLEQFFNDLPTVRVVFNIFYIFIIPTFCLWLSLIPTGCYLMKLCTKPLKQFAGTC